MGTNSKREKEDGTMNAERMSQEVGATREAGSDGRARLAEYLAEQSQSRRTFDKVMKGLELAGVALAAGCLAWAIYVSASWSEPGKIVAMWFGFMASVTIPLILVGVHAAGLRAFFPLGMLANAQKLVTGSSAVAMGLGFAVIVAVVGAFWGTFAWGIWTEDWSILEPMSSILGVVVGVGVVVAVASDLYKRFFRSR
jgi:hypothetical protein